MSVNAHHVRDQLRVAGTLPAVNLDRAERDRETSRLGQRLAYRGARVDVETLAMPRATAVDCWWYDTSTLAPGCAEAEREFLAESVRYLGLRRLLRFHDSEPNLVQVRDWP